MSHGEGQEAQGLAVSRDGTDVGDGRDPARRLRCRFVRIIEVRTYVRSIIVASRTSVIDGSLHG